MTTYSIDNSDAKNSIIQAVGIMLFETALAYRFMYFSRQRLKNMSVAMVSMKVSVYERDFITALRKAADNPVPIAEIQDEYITQKEFMNREGQKSREQMRTIRQKLMKVQGGLKYEGGEKVDPLGRTVRRNYRYNYSAYIRLFKNN